MAAEEIIDREGVIKGPHGSLVRRYPFDELELAVLAVLRHEETVSLSQLWRRFGCHLWEIVEVLRRLQEKELVTEHDLPLLNDL